METETAARVKVRQAHVEDLPDILDIYNEQVLGGVATFDIEPKTLEERKQWFEEHQSPAHPITVATLDGRVLGWASLSPFKSRPAYNCTVEISTYVHKDARGLGIGKRLVADLVDRARKAKMHTIVAYIVKSNSASIRMVEACGFDVVGELAQVGYKFDAWHDVVITQCMLEETR